jgi:hypothetical protein
MLLHLLIGFGVGLLARRRRGESGNAWHAARCASAWDTAKVHVDAARVGELRHEADVGERRRIAVA